MGEPRGKLEHLISDLEAKKAEIMKQLEEYELILPSLQESLAKLDEAGITGTESAAAPQAQSAPEAEAPAEAPKPKIQEVKSEPAEEEEKAEPEAAEEAEAEAEAEAEGEEGEEKPRRSIASLVADG